MGVGQLLSGIKSYLEGLGWLRRHPKSMVLLFMPMVLSLIFLILGVSLFIEYGDDLFRHTFVLDKPVLVEAADVDAADIDAAELASGHSSEEAVADKATQQSVDQQSADQQSAVQSETSFFSSPLLYFKYWGHWVLYGLCLALFYIGGFIVCVVACLLVSSVLASPVYEIVSVNIEKDVNGGQVKNVSFWKSMLLMKEELKKVVLILLISLAAMLIPVVNFFSIPITAFLLGWDFYDYTLARRGYNLADRIKVVKTDFLGVLGLGLWLVIPFVQFILMPIAIAGGTLMSLNRLDGAGIHRQSPAV